MISDTNANPINNDTQEKNITDREELLVHHLLTALTFLLRSRDLLLVFIFLFCHVDSPVFLSLTAYA